MPARRLTTALVAVAAAGALALACLYGPSRRVVLPAPQLVPVASAAEACAVWEEAGMRGRIALVVARNFVPAEFGLTAADVATFGPEVEAITAAMHHGLVREVRHLIPEARWPAVSRSLAHVTIYWPSGAGVVGAFEDGRVHVLPLSRLGPVPEPVLLLVDARVTAPAELDALARRLQDGSLRADLVTVIGGEPATLDLLASSLAAGAAR